MRHSLRLCSALIPAVFLLLTSCDTTDGPTNVFQEDPVVTGLQISPSELDFTEEDGVKDTLVTFQVTARSELPDNYSLVAVLASASDRTRIDSDTLTRDETADLYNGSLSAAMRTTDHRNLTLYVYAAGDRADGNRAESVIKIRGTSAGHPEVLQIHHSDTVYIPPPGETTTFDILADVTHSVSLSLVDLVWLELYDKDDNRIYRDRMDEISSESDDFRRYTEGFSLGSDNSPDSITVQVYATDRSGTRSDTLRSHFIISR